MKFFLYGQNDKNLPVLIAKYDSHFKLESCLKMFFSPEEGSDCITSAVAGKKEDLGPSGSFYTDRAAVSKHLPLACTVESSSDRVKLVEIMESFFTETLTKTETLTRSF